MTDPTINRQPAIDLFDQLMQPDGHIRVLRLEGESKMGKTHLVAKVFHALAQDTYKARCAVLDLRNQAQTIPDILDAACSLLGGEADFPAYYAAYGEWLNRPRVEITGLRAIFSRVSVRSEDEGAESRKWVRRLTQQFVADLRQMADEPVALLFDALERADESKRTWLMDTLLVQLVPLSHLRVVLAGQQVPEARGSYDALCHSHDLPPVEEEKEYVDYCHLVGAELDE